MRHWLMLGAVAALGACTGMGATPPRAEPRVAAPPINTPPQGAFTQPSDGAGTIPPVSRGGRDACGASQYRHLIGQPLPQPFNTSGPVRIYTTGQPVTMDHNPQRLNIEVDSSSQRRIVAVSCG